MAVSLSATCSCEGVLPTRLRPDFLVVSRVMREMLSTGPCGRRDESGLSPSAISVRIGSASAARTDREHAKMEPRRQWQTCLQGELKW